MYMQVRGNLAPDKADALLQGAAQLAEPAAIEPSPLILQANFSFPAEALHLQNERSSSISGSAKPAEAQVRQTSLHACPGIASPAE